MVKTFLTGIIKKKYIQINNEIHPLYRFCYNKNIIYLRTECYSSVQFQRQIMVRSSEFHNEDP